MGLMSWLRGDRSASGAVPVAPDVARPDDRSERVDVNRLVPMQRTVSGQDLVIDPTGLQGR
ncbi:hypothetical protein NKH18_27030 [Streptomyces sp. M10(2022)]